MKTNNVVRLTSIVAILFFNAGDVFAKSLHSLPPEVKIIGAKFTIAMIGVLGFSFLIYVCLSLYNRFFVDSQIKDFNLRKDSLKSPHDFEEAIMLFITKNRLK